MYCRCIEKKFNVNLIIANINCTKNPLALCYTYEGILFCVSKASPLNAHLYVLHPPRYERITDTAHAIPKKLLRGQCSTRTLIKHPLFYSVYIFSLSFSLFLSLSFLLSYSHMFDPSFSSRRRVWSSADDAKTSRKRFLDICIS